MIFWTWRSYFIRWQIFENKVWCPVSKKRTKYFHFLLSLAYPIDRLDWALFSVVILFHHLFPLLEKVEIRVFILPRNFPAVLIIFTGRGRAGNPPFPTVRDGAGNPPLPAGRVPRGAGRPSLDVGYWSMSMSGKDINQWLLISAPITFSLRADLMTSLSSSCFLYLTRLSFSACFIDSCLREKIHGKVKVPFLT